MSDDPLVYRRLRRRSYIPDALEAGSVFPFARADVDPGSTPGVPRCARCERAVCRSRDGWRLVTGADNGCAHAPIPCTVAGCYAPGTWWDGTGYRCAAHAAHAARTP